MSEPPAVSIRDARVQLADLVDRAYRDNQPTIITRRGKPVAAVVSIEVLRQLDRWETEWINRIARGPL